jgi:hypothetical protein
MKNFFKKYKNKKGYAILFTVVIVSAISVITAGLTNAAYKQLILSSLAKDSQSAFYQADTAADCALYADQVEYIKPAPNIFTEGTWTCGGSDLVIENVTPTGYTISPTEEIEDSLNPCFRIDVTKVITAPPAPDWQSGLVSKWSFDTDATDPISGNNGTPTNGPTLTSTNCKSGSCYSFDGSDDYISVPDNPSLDLGSYTISAWVYPEDVGGWHTIVAKGETEATMNYAWQIGSSISLLEDGYGSDYYARASSPTYSSNTLYFVTAVADASAGELRLYVNGVEHTYSSQGWGGDPIIDDDPLTIGSSETWGEYFDGTIDEVMLWDRALSDTEIDEVYNSYPTNPTWQAGLLSWWKLDGNTNDSIGSNNGTNNGGTITDVGCRNNQCYSFGGTDQFIDLPAISIPGNKGSMSAWFTASNPNEYEVAFGRYWTQNMIGTYGSPYISGSWVTDDGQNNVSSNVELDENLHNVIVTYDGDSSYNNLNMYLDGVFVDTENAYGDNAMNDRIWQIGAHGDSDMEWTGTVDEVMLWDRPINEIEVQEVQTLATPSDPPVSYSTVSATISAKGYNICNKSNLRTVEREIEINYEKQS